MEKIMPSLPPGPGPGKLQRVSDDASRPQVRQEMIIFIGLQGSGKSTFFRTYFAGTHAYISKDLLRNNKRPSRRQHQLIEEALQSGQSVVIDNTNPTKEEREALISLGKHYGAKIIGYYFESQVSQALERNKQRTGKARVPDVAIYVTASKLVRSEYEEGFDELFEVRIKHDDTFEISPSRENR
jgi:predicted kinase